MRVLLVARGPAYLPNFRPVLRALAERGHEVVVAFETQQERAGGQLALVDDLAAAHPGVARRRAPLRRDRWRLTANHLRRGLDYLRYLEPMYRTSPQFRARARSRAPESARLLLGARLLRRPRARALVKRLYRHLEAAVPVPRRFERFVQNVIPDVLVVTPLISLGGSQTDFLRAARRLRIPTVAWVYSWDNLTSKGGIHEVPDRLVVWNDAQRREALELHGVPLERVVVTGAQAWDHWFDWAPSTTREEFAARVGLPADRPFVLYLGSSGGGLGLEAPAVERWIAAMHRSGLPRLSSASVLVRPHPYGASGQWEKLDRTNGEPVSVFPRAGEQPTSERARADFFDSIYHSAAVAGVNTSAFIESAIVGRPVLSVPSPEFEIAQTGTAHFTYFLQEGGGLLSLPGSMDEHLRELDAALASGGGFEETRRRFLEAFVRPHGLDQPATPRVVATVEGAAAEPPPRPPTTLVRMLTRLALEALLRVLAFEEPMDKRRRRMRRKTEKALEYLEKRADRGASRLARRGRRHGQAAISAASRRVRAVGASPSR